MSVGLGAGELNQKPACKSSRLSLKISVSNRQQFVTISDFGKVREGI